MLPSPGGSDRFDALAAEAELTEAAVLPSPILREEPETAASDLITTQDLAHLTGNSAPEINGWDSTLHSEPQQRADDIESPGDNESVSPAILAGLVLAAGAIVIFAAYSILSNPAATQTETVAMVDPTSTSVSSTTITIPVTVPEPRLDAIGIDLAEQISRVCAGEQFGITRAEAPTLATHNDLVTSIKDGRNDWVTAPDQTTLRSPVPPLVGCLTTADAGEIDRCPTDGYIISRRSVDWSYRVIQTIDGTVLGADAGTTTDVHPCEELAAQAGGEDSAFWSDLPQDRIDLVAADYTSAPHPNVACTATATAPPQEWAATEPLAVDAAFVGLADVELPDGWQATEERPVDVVICLDEVRDDEVRGNDESAATPPGEQAVAAPCPTSLKISAALRDRTPLGSWVYDAPSCNQVGEPLAPPFDWWIDTLGPVLGYSDASAAASSGE